jgi:exosortase
MAELAQAVSASEAPSQPSRRTRLWQAIALLAVAGWLYAPILVRLVVQWWSDPNFSHGFFVPAFSLFLLWQNRSRLGQIQPAPSLWGLPLIVLAMCTLVLGVFGAELFLSRMSLIILIGGLTVFFMGWEVLRVVLFPLLFLVLMVPLPAIVFSQITFPLQILASQLSAWLLPFLGVPVLREGNVINLPAMPLEVAEACSGIRSLLSLTTLAIMYGYLLEKRVVIRVVLALASVPIAVAANGLRIVGTGLLVQYWDPDKAEGFFHVFSGWLIFVVSLVMLFILHQCLTFFDRRKEAVA